MIIRTAWITCPSTLYSPKTHPSSSLPQQSLAHSHHGSRSLNESRFHVRGYMIRHDHHAVRYGSAEQDEPFHLAIDALNMPQGCAQRFGRRRHVQPEAVRTPRLHSATPGRHAEIRTALTPDFSEPSAPPPWPRGILVQVVQRQLNEAKRTNGVDGGESSVKPTNPRILTINEARRASNSPCSRPRRTPADSRWRN